MAEIVVVVVKCYKTEVDPPRLVMLIDAVLKQQGYEVREVMARIEEEK